MQSPDNAGTHRAVTGLNTLTLEHTGPHTGLLQGYTWGCDRAVHTDAGTHRATRGAITRHR